MITMLVERQNVQKQLKFWKTQVREISQLMYDVAVRGNPYRQMYVFSWIVQWCTASCGIGKYARANTLSTVC
jgi:hypothetical protein